MTLLVLLFLPLLVSLGLWQLTRAEEKQTLLLSYQQLQTEPKVNVDSLTAEQLTNYLPVSLQGTFDRERYWLLDNRSRNGSTGYEVLVPFVTDYYVVLVNIGWVRASPDRSELPAIDLPTDLIKIAGHLYTPQKNALIANGATDLPIPWPKRVLQIDWDAVERHLDVADSGKMLLTKTVRVDSADPVALVTDWSPVNINPMKHKGYAFQWFAMSVALLILYGWYLYSETKLLSNGKDER